MTTDLHGNELRVGDRVRAWQDGREFTATITGIKVGRGHTSGTDLLTLRRDDGQAVERNSDAVKLQ